MREKQTLEQRTNEKKTKTRWEAARAQISTALVGLLGALVALAFESSDDLETLLMWEDNTLVLDKKFTIKIMIFLEWYVFSRYILPFTAGGFLNIALVSVVPELMEVNKNIM